MGPHEQDELDARGYIVLHGFIKPPFLADLRSRTDKLFELEGENAGSEFRSEPNSRRLANLVAKGEVYQRLVSTPELLERIGAVLGRRFKLSSLNARSANPRSDSRQPL